MEFKVNTFNIMALPTENVFEVDLKTLDLNLILKPNFASFGLLYPFPGTAIARMAISRGYFEEDKDTLYLDSNKNQSMLKFKSNYEKRKIFENLQKLAGIYVDFPFLRILSYLFLKLKLWA